MKNLKGKVAFITGGSRGIGAGIAKRLAAEGADIVFTHSGKNEPKADEILSAIHANGVKGLALVADNEDPKALTNALENTIRKFGAIDILVNNAGIGIMKPMNEHTLDEFDKLVNVHIKAVFVASQFVARHMKSGSRIITIGSNLAERVSAAGASLYAMSKSALSGLTKGMARDLGSKNITVNLIQPGPVDTEMNPADGEFAPYQKSLTALNRYGNVEEIGGLVAYLANEESQYITGTAITIDGGFNI
jgi:3-oxoacyl-[acyl-carrier protein] reductase